MKTERPRTGGPLACSFFMLTLKWKGTCRTVNPSAARAHLVLCAIVAGAQPSSRSNTSCRLLAQTPLHDHLQHASGRVFLGGKRGSMTIFALVGVIASLLQKLRKPTASIPSRSIRSPRRPRKLSLALRTHRDRSDVTIGVRIPMSASEILRRQTGVVQLCEASRSPGMQHRA